MDNTSNIFYDNGFGSKRNDEALNWFYNPTSCYWEKLDISIDYKLGDNIINTSSQISASSSSVSTPITHRNVAKQLGISRRQLVYGLESSKFSSSGSANRIEDLSGSQLKSVICVKKEDLKFVPKEVKTSVASKSKSPQSNEGVFLEKTGNNLINNDEIVNMNIKNDGKFISNFNLSRFRSACGTNNFISGSTLQIARKTFNEIDLNIPVNVTPKTIANEFVGFTSASGSKISICEIALRNSKRLLGEFEATPPSVKPQKQPILASKLTSEHQPISVSKYGKESITTPLAICHRKQTDFSNFQSLSSAFTSAKGTPISVSKSALNTVKGVLGFNDDFSSDSETKISASNSALHKVNTTLLNNDGDNPAVRTSVCLPQRCFDDAEDDFINSQFLQELDAREKSPFMTDPYIMSSRVDVSNVEPPFLTNPIDFNGSQGTNSSFKTPYNVEADAKKRGAIETLDYEGQFIKRTRFDVQSIHQTVNKVELSRQNQRKNIETKKASTKGIIALPGSLWNSKRSKEKQICLDQLEKFRHTQISDLLFESGVTESTLKVTSKSARDYQFDVKTLFSSGLKSGGIPIGGDGALVIPNDDNKIGVEEISLALWASPGVNPVKMSKAWIENHFRLIVWKLACLERHFPTLFGAAALTPNEVTRQLKYRYDREIDNGERSALRKIYEHDETPSKCIVLCVSAITYTATAVVMELTDGWYFISSSPDQDVFKELINKGKIRIGTKLITWGAEFADSNCTACSPLDFSSNTHHLKLHANSTRRARWYTRLGFHPYIALPSRLKNIIPTGGNVSQIDVLIVRTYPLLFVERKEPGCRTVYMNERVFQRRNLNVEARYDNICQEVQLEFEEKQNTCGSSLKRFQNKSFSDAQIAELSDGAEIAAAIEVVTDPDIVQSKLNSTQLDMLKTFQLRKKESLYNDMRKEIKRRTFFDGKTDQPKIASPLFRLKIVDLACYKAGNSVFSGTLSFWRPSEDSRCLLKEGKAFRIFNLSTGISSRNNQISLTVTRQTRFEPLVESLNSSHSPEIMRKITALQDILLRSFVPQFYELDTVGIVVYISSRSAGSGGFQCVYLTDLFLNLIRVNVWNDLDDFGLRDVIVRGNILLFRNLQWRSTSTKGLITSVYVTENSVVTASPKDEQGLKEMQRWELSTDDKKHLIANAEDFLSSQLLADSKRKDSSLVSPSADSIAPNSPRYLQSFQNKNRLRKLEMYGDPPPLPPSPILITKTSGSYARRFVTPFKNKKSKFQISAEKSLNTPNKTQLNQDLDLISHNSIDSLTV